LAWRLGPPATQIVPIFLLTLTVHFVALGWGYAQFSPLVRIIQLATGIVRDKMHPTDPLPHGRDARRKLFIYLPLWIGLFPTLPPVVWTVLISFAAVLMFLAVYEVVRGTLFTSKIWQH